MGVADREYMRDIPVYRDTVRRRGSQGAAAAAVVSLIVGGYVFRAPLHLVRVGHHTAFTMPGDRTFTLDLPATVQSGTLITERGRIGSGTSGTVVVAARVNGGPWLRLASTNTDDSGGYVVRFPLDQPGAVDVRVDLPDGDTGVAHVIVTGASAATPTGAA